MIAIQALPLRRAALAFTWLLCLGAAPAHAGCAGSDAVDQCLVGAWKQTGGGAVEWMRRNMPPGMTISQFDQSGQRLVLKDDGTFWTAPSAGDAKVRMQGPRGTLEAESNVKVRSSGRWSAFGGKFQLCADEQKFEGQARVTIPGGGSQTMQLAPPPSTGPVAFGYTCSGDTLETVQSFPGMPDPMTTQYRRAEAE